VIGTGSYPFTGSTLTGLTVDPQGNIYLAARTQNNSSIVKVTPSGAASVLPTLGLTPVINNPQGVAADAMGNIYVVDSANSRIVKITNAGLVSAFSISGLTSPATLSSITFGVTVDSYGNLYIPDWSNNRLVFVNVSSAALKFANTNAGSTSSDSPKTATVTNLGNQSLLFSTNPAFTADFSNSSADTNAAVTFYRGLGVAVNLTGGHASNIESGVDLDKVSFMMGPRYTYQFKNWFGHDFGRPGGGRIFGEGLIGGVHSFNTVVPTSAGVAGAATYFVFQVGGGVDLPLRKGIGIRLFEADYVRSTLPNGGNSTQNDLRLAAGISFHFTN
jgi:NHL repeat